MPPRFDPLLDLEAGFPWRKELRRLLNPMLVLAGVSLLVAGALRWLQETGVDAPPQTGILIPDAGLVFGLWATGIVLLCTAAVLHRQA